MSYCEDYPACGHTPLDPCERQWYDEPGAFDITRPGNEHALCDHEIGECRVYDDEEPECEDDEHECVDCERNGFGTPWRCSWCDRPCPKGAHEDEMATEEV